MKIVFTMRDPQPKKHSVRFDFDAVEETDGPNAPADLKGFKPSFYIPKPVAENATRIRVTIEEIE